MTQIEAKCPECDKLAWSLEIACPDREVPHRIVDGPWRTFEAGPTTYVTFGGMANDGRTETLSLSFPTKLGRIFSASVPLPVVPAPSMLPH